MLNNKNRPILKVRTVRTFVYVYNVGESKKTDFYKGKGDLEKGKITKFLIKSLKTQTISNIKQLSFKKQRPYRKNIVG